MAAAVAVLAVGAVVIAIGVATWADRTVHLNIGHRRTLDRLHDAVLGEPSLRGSVTRNLGRSPDHRRTGTIAFANQMARSILHGPTIDVSRQLGQPDLERLVEQARTTRDNLAEDVTLWIPGAKTGACASRAAGRRRNRLVVVRPIRVLPPRPGSSGLRRERVARAQDAGCSHPSARGNGCNRTWRPTIWTPLRFVERLGVEVGSPGRHWCPICSISRASKRAPN